MRCLHTLFLAALALFPAFAAKDTCYECHFKLRGKLKGPAALWANDVHRENGMTCAICHGGDATKDDLVGSKTSEFIGTFRRPDVAELCGGCHSDAERIHKVNAGPPLDQLAQYRASVHGRRLAAGDEASATCIDCHSVHDIRKVSDPQSPVAPLRQPDTCGCCHSSPELMAGRNLPVNQVDDYRSGGHWMQLSTRGNARAARCASCHGDHDTAPAKTLLTSATCRPCHGSEEQVYRNRAHSGIHPDERSRGCVGCHGSHAVRRRPEGGQQGRAMPVGT